MDNLYKKELTEEEFKKFRDYIYKKSGINYTINKKIILQNRIRRRLRDLGLNSYLEYFNLIKNKPIDSPEMIKFFDEVTTNETSFFRHERQFVALKSMIIPELLEIKRNKDLNVWSAAASMGKEAYTISMVLKETVGLHNYKMKILGTDLNNKVLNMAKLGEYDIKDGKDIPREYEKYVIRDKENGILKIKEDLKKMIEFKRFNLKESYSFFPKMDVIFCRNVFIYFEKKTQKEMVDKFYDRLIPGGFFILGHSETLNGVSDKFIYRKFNGENLMIYQKPLK
ncbi:CheR family methyltransferase [Haliovirga abyssi]|uniref:protein-glutamate O-methyltransferase n=1 Tax=Haliovirga abyssi TaxID=2996794 RepID=A0AAU9DJC8_9FUSO|nr:protein-glutamate O-methyltransferase CheR [Haliovirga abyssi]BDU49977.1 chemotaxis protein methyltransferase [Haliovirga abyssi]